MGRWQKILASIWTTILIAPLLLAMVAYVTGECGEYDSCPTGAPFPHRTEISILLASLIAVQAAFLAMIWAGGDKESSPGAPE